GSAAGGRAARPPFYPLAPRLAPSSLPVVTGARHFAGILPSRLPLRPRLPGAFVARQERAERKVTPLRLDPLPAPPLLPLKHQAPPPQIQNPRCERSAWAPGGKYGMIRRRRRYMTSLARELRVRGMVFVGGAFLAALVALGMHCY